MLLQQKQYEDENGKMVDASTIYSVSPYIYIVDGFFSWSCQNCKKDNSSRAFKVNGTVQTCEHCRNKSLLLRSDCDNINDIVRRVNLLSEQIEGKNSLLRGLQKDISEIKEIQEKLSKEVCKTVA